MTHRGDIFLVPLKGDIIVVRSQANKKRPHTQLEKGLAKKTSFGQVVC